MTSGPRPTVACDMHHLLGVRWSNLEVVMVSRVYTQTIGENFAGSRIPSRLEHPRWLLCASCQCRDDLLLPEYFEAEILCLECRSPLRSLDFPEYYCDLGEGD